MFKQMLSTLNVNLINFVLRILFTFILGDVLKLDIEIYYPLLLALLIYIGLLVSLILSKCDPSKTKPPNIVKIVSRVSPSPPCFSCSW